jgi:hypothetical protein
MQDVKHSRDQEACVEILDGANQIELAYSRCASKSITAIGHYQNPGNAAVSL